MSFLEESWKERENILYKQLFSVAGIGIFPLTNEIFERMNANSIDPRWFTYGVFKFPPANERTTWAYVTSGMSNPWETEEPEEYSGLGVEFLMETENEENWAIEVLQTLTAYNLLLSSGKMGDFPPLNYGHRVPLALSNSINTMMFTSPLDFPESFNIKSGQVDLLQVVGVTSEEAELAKQTSSDNLRQILLDKTTNLITNKERTSVI